MNCCGGTLLLFSAPCNSLSTIASLLLQSFNHSFTCNNLASPTCCSLQVGPKISRSATAIVLLFYREGRDAPHPPGRPRPHSLNPSPAPFPVQNRDKFHSSRAGCWLVTNRFLADDHLFDADDLRDVVDRRFELAVAKTLIDASQQLGVHVAAAVDACTATDQMSHDELLTALSRVCTSAKTQPTAKGV